MRIISGKYRGRSIVAPANLPVRPTTDFAKTGLFNILQNRLEFSTCSCLDLFSGTGSISFEFISRGCKQVTSIDRDPGCIQFQNDIAHKLKIINLKIIKSDAFIFLEKNNQKYKIIFADPPFESSFREELHKQIFSTSILANDGLFVLEHITGEKYDHLKGFLFSRIYGNVTFSFFSNFGII